MLYGAGSLMFISKDLDSSSLRGQQLVYPGYLSSFELSADTQLIEARALIDGKRQIVAAAVGEEIFTMTITTEFTDWSALQFAYDELAQESTGVVLPVLKVARVPLVTPFTIVDTDITTTTEASVRAYVASTGPWGERIFLKRVTTAPADATEFQITAATGTLTFHSSLAGATIQYIVNKTYPSLETIGFESTADTFGRLEFFGVGYSTEGKKLVHIPELSRISTPTLSINGEGAAELTIEFRASVPSGRRRPFILYNLD